MEATTTGIVVRRDRSSANWLLAAGAKWETMTKAIPVSNGKASKSALYATRPPAEPPMPTMKVGCELGIIDVRSPSRSGLFLQQALLFFRHSRSPRTALADHLLLVCGGIHLRQGNSIITQDQFVDIAGVAHATRLDDVESTNAPLPRILLQFSDYDPCVNQGGDADLPAGVILCGRRDEARKESGDALGFQQVN